MSFLSKISVAGYQYTGMGNSTNKKDAQANAARDFCNHLVRQGEMQQAEVPSPAETQVTGPIELSWGR